MPNPQYRKGAREERALARLLRGAGFRILRSPGSKGPDLLVNGRPASVKYGTHVPVGFQRLSRITLFSDAGIVAGPLDALMPGDDWGLQFAGRAIVTDPVPKFIAQELSHRDLLFARRKRAPWRFAMRVALLAELAGGVDA